jgi:hypothetical protein
MYGLRACLLVNAVMIIAMVLVMRTGRLPSSLAAMGQAEYAEVLNDSVWYKMPFNAAVNAGYLWVAFVWGRFLWRHQKRAEAAVEKAGGYAFSDRDSDGVILNASNRFLLTMFLVMTFVYGPVQFSMSVAVCSLHND